MPTKSFQAKFENFTFSLFSTSPTIVQKHVIVSVGVLSKVSQPFVSGDKASASRDVQSLTFSRWTQLVFSINACIGPKLLYFRLFATRDTLIPFQFHFYYGLSSLDIVLGLTAVPISLKWMEKVFTARIHKKLLHQPSPQNAWFFTYDSALASGRGIETWALFKNWLHSPCYQNEDASKPHDIRCKIHLKTGCMVFDITRISYKSK